MSQTLKLTVPLFDVESLQEGEPQLHQVTLEISRYGIEVHFSGYGTFDQPDDQGSPVLIEIAYSPRVVLYNDINQQEPQIIDLASAQLSLREESHDTDQLDDRFL